MAGAFSYRRVQELAAALNRHQVRYLFMGKGGAVLLGFSDTTQDAERRAIDIEGIRVAHIDDIIRSKEAANRIRDREALPRLRAFREWWKQRQSEVVDG